MLNTIVNIIRILLVLCIVALGFVWFIAQASGHNIPDKTNYTFLLAIVILIAFVAISFWPFRMKRQEHE